MSGTEVRALGRLGPAARRFAWEHPEAWPFAAAAVAWAFMLAHAVAHGAHAHHHVMAAPMELFHWVLMIVAMMIPLMGGPVRSIVFRSFRRLRYLVMATFVAGYLAVWAIVGLPVVALRGAAFSHDHRVAALAFSVASAWTLSGPHARGLNACHYQRALAPSGWPAARDSLTFGARLGVACVKSCWPLMLACAVTGHSVVAMIGTGVIGAWERLSFRPPIRGAALAILGLAAWHAILAWMG